MLFTLLWFERCTAPSDAIHTACFCRGRTPLDVALARGCDVVAWCPVRVLAEARARIGHTGRKGFLGAPQHKPAVDSR